MSLQVCHCCGWSKVTTYRGLRIHQGRMGCTPTGVKIVEPEQKYLWGSVVQMDVQMDLKLDVYTSIKAETKTYYPDLSLQVCHCGWSKMTTYQGLRIHQGKKGCTPKGSGIIKTEKGLRRDHQEKDQGKHLIKPENFPEPPRMSSPINCAAATASVKEELKSPVPRCSSIQSKPGHRQEEFSTLPQVSRLVRVPSTALNLDVVRATKKKTKSLTVPRNTDEGGIEDHLKTYGRYNFTTAAARIKEEPSSPFTTLDVSAKNRSQQSIDKLVDFSSDLQRKTFYDGGPWTLSAVRPEQRDSRDRASSRMNGLVREHPQISQIPEPVVQPKEKPWEDQQVNRSVREQLPAPPAVPPKKNSLLLTERREGRETQLLRDIQNFLAERKLNRQEKFRDIRPAEPSCETNGSVSERRTAPPVLPPKKKDSLFLREKPEGVKEAALQSKDEDSGGEKLEQSSSPSIKSAAAAPVVGENQSPPETSLDSVKNSTNTEAAAAEQGNGSVREQSAARPAFPPQKKNLPSFTTEPKKAESGLQEELPNNKTRGKKICVVKPVETESVGRTETTETSPEEVPPPLTEAVQPDVSSGLKVKDLARMFSVAAAQEKTSRPKEKLGEEKRLSQVKIFAQRFSAAQTEETTGQPKKKNKVEQKQTQVKELAQVFSVQQAAARLKDKPGHGEKPRLSQVKILAQRFLPSTVQETAAELKEADGEEQKPTQRLPGSTSAATKLNTAALKAPAEEEQKSSYEATQLSGYSSGWKVKDLARMFSADEIQKKSA